jgi:GTP-binding protein HflX
MTPSRNRISTKGTPIATWSISAIFLGLAYCSTRTSAFQVSKTITKPCAYTRDSQSRLHVISPPQDEQLPTPLFDVDDVQEDTSSTSSSNMEQKPDDEVSEGNSFYDVDYEDDDITDTDWEPVQAEAVSGDDGDDEYATFNRDEDDILTEREDRLFVDENGLRRKIETCVLVGVEELSSKRKARLDETRLPAEEWEVYFSLEESMKEMRELIKTAGLECVGEVTQRLQEVNPKTYIGTGKVKEADELLHQHEACTIVFDAELSPGQQKALENAFNKKIIQDDFLGAESGEIKILDRTALILDIFAQHAKTREGKLQVDLALHEYRKPRLTRMWTHLERQSGAGGVGLRGPGESQLEIDKRLVRDRIITLKQKIDGVHKQRALHRKGRTRTGLPILSLVGYTNAGKSTLLNKLTKAGVMAESMLFATLDPTTRKVKLPGYKTHPEVLLTDTVGFIQKLPTHLVAAFRATLEEVREADVLIHVIDVSNPVWEKQERAVRTVLNEIDASDKPIVRVFNKIDLLPDDDAEYLRYEAAMTSNSVAVSSVRGDGLQDFVAVVEDALADLLVPIEVIVPYNKGEELNLVHEVGNVETVDYREEGTYILGRVPKAVANRLEQYNVNQPQGIDSEGVDEDEIDWNAIGRGRHSAKNL